MAKSSYRKSRIILSRLFIVLMVVFLATSTSVWEEKQPLVSTFLFMAGIFFVAIASLGRLWCSLYIAGLKTTTLVTQGPYSISRNPLYFFSLIGGIGVGLTSETLLVPSMILVAFAVYYPFVITHEETKLKAVHPETFVKYMQSVPRFFPKINLLDEPWEYLVNPIIFKKHMFSALWFVWIVGLLELIEEFHELGFLPVFYKVF